MGTGKVFSGSQAGKVQYPYDAMVYIDGTSVIAVDSEGNTIRRGVAGTDDTNVIQMAIATGGVVQLMSDDYTIIDSLIIPSDTKLIGYGATFIVNELGTDDEVIHVGGNTCNVTGLEIDGSGLTTPRDGIVCDNLCEYITFEDLYLHDLKSGIKFPACHRVRINRCKSENTTQYAFTNQGSLCKYVYITNCETSGSTYTAYTLNPVYYGFIDNCIDHDSSVGGIDVSGGSKEVYISNCSVDTSQRFLDDEDVAHPAEMVYVTNCESRTTSSSAFFVRGTISISNTSVIDPTGYAINMQEGRLLITNCRFSGQDAMISIPNAGDVQILNCYFYGVINTTGAIHSYGKIKLDNCEFDGCKQAVRCYAGGSNYSSITNNYIQNCTTGYPIHVRSSGGGDSVDGILISGNTLVENAEHDINLDLGAGGYITNPIVTNNYIYHSGKSKYGIYITNANVINPLIIDNRMIGTLGIYVISSHSGDMIHNNIGYVHLSEIRDPINNTLEIMGTPRLLLPMEKITGTSVTDYTRNSNSFVAQSSVATWYGFQGRATYYDFDGAAKYLYRSDDADFNFGNGINDSSFSLISCVCPDNVVSRSIITRWTEITGSEAREWRLFFDASGYPTLQLYDESIDKYIGRQDQTAFTTDSWKVLITTYDGSGICAGIKIYIDGTRVDDADYEDAGYVAMENVHPQIKVGAIHGIVNPGMYYDGKMTWVGVAAKELSPDEVWSLTQRLKGVLGI